VKEPLLDFIRYVPAGYGDVAGSPVPGIEETDDPNKLFTAVFRGGEEEWRGTIRVFPVGDVS